MVTILLSACGPQKESTEFVDIPPSLLVACERPVEVPLKDLSQSEVEKLWLKDRRELISCKSKHEILAKNAERMSQLDN